MNIEELQSVFIHHSLLQCPYIPRGTARRPSHAGRIAERSNVYMKELMKMKKTRAVISLLLVAVVTGLMAYTVLVGLGKGHRGSYHNIKKGLDLAGGASITYQAVGEEPPTQEDLNDTKY
jgi:hypothetical protein